MTWGGRWRSALCVMWCALGVVACDDAADDTTRCSSPPSEAYFGDLAGGDLVCSVSAECDGSVYEMSCTFDACTCTIDGGNEETIAYEDAYCAGGLAGEEGDDWRRADEACGWDKSE